MIKLSDRHWLSEASTATTAEQKMRDWHAGKRKENIKACSEAKLLAYLETCINLGREYVFEIQQLLAEAHRRKLSWGSDAFIFTDPNDPRFPIQLVNSSTVSVDPYDAVNIGRYIFGHPILTDDVLVQIMNYENKAEPVIDVLATTWMTDPMLNRSVLLRDLVKTHSITQLEPLFILCRNLVVAKMLGCEHTVDAIKDFIQRCGSDVAALAKGILTLSADARGKTIQELDNRVSALIKRLNVEESLNNSSAKSIKLTENIEKHSELNPRLWTADKQLKPKVRDQILKIADYFIANLAKDGIKFKLKDIRIVGSNCSYNYTKDSDLDIHLIADKSSLVCPDNLYPLLYSAYRSIFNKNLDIKFYGIPVELYIEIE